ncbi:MAG: FAD binding domain-containing protein [Devosia sp.]
MIPGAFDYHRPSSLADAVKLMGSLGDDATILAGGHSLIPMMKLRMATPEHLVDLGGLGELRRIEVNGSAVSIGAMVTQAQVIASTPLAAAVPILMETSTQIADPQVRNLGTIGGNVANGDPGNDMPAVMQALDATYVLSGPNGAREVKAREFYSGSYATARAPGEILSAIRIIAPPAGHGYAYEKQKRKIGDYATAAAAVILTMSGGRCTAASIALTNVGETALWAREAGAALVGTPVDDQAIKAAVAAAKAIATPSADGRGPIDFRLQVTGVMVRRAIEKARSRAR